MTGLLPCPVSGQGTARIWRFYDKTIFSALLAALMLALTLTTAAFAVDESKSFDFVLSVDGKAERQAVTGDVITVTFTLRRTDADEPYPLYAMQNEILYDGTFFELVPGSGMANNSIRTTDITLRDGYHAFYMNRASLTQREKRGRPTPWSVLSS